FGFERATPRSVRSSRPGSASLTRFPPLGGNTCIRCRGVLHRTRGGSTLARTLWNSQWVYFRGTIRGAPEQSTCRKSSASHHNLLPGGQAALKPRSSARPDDDRPSQAATPRVF